MKKVFESVAVFLFLAAFFSCSDMLTQAETPAVYTITFDAQKGHVSTPSITVNASSGIPGWLPNPVYTGFVFTGWNRKPDGTGAVVTRTSRIAESMTVYAQWSPCAVAFTFNANGGTWSDGTSGDKTITGRYGDPVVGVPEDLSLAGYRQAGWDKPIPAVYPLGGETFTAKWTAKENTLYTVRHWRQNTDDDDYTLYETEILAGTTGAQTAAVARAYDGFTVQSFAQKKIDASGITIVQVYYTRKIITITFVPDGGIWSDGTSGNRTITDRFDKLIGIVPTVKKDCYDFLEWSPQIPLVMPAQNTLYTAIWAKTPAPSEPAISPDAGTYDSGTVITIVPVPADENVSIRYTIDGTDPSADKGTLYTGPISLTVSHEIKAVAVRNGVASSICSRIYYTKKIEIKMIIRDFRGYNETGVGDGYITDEIAGLNKAVFTVGHGHPDFEHYSGSGTQGLVNNLLGDDGLPVFKSTGHSQISSKESFSMWYRDTDGVNKRIDYTFPIVKKGSTWNFTSTSFFPIDGQGYGNMLGTGHNYSFTTQTRYKMRYEGGESIQFIGDDDMWIFLNGHLAIDMGGLHSSYSASLILNDAKAAALDLEKGSVYYIDVFHAERHTTSSNYTLSIKAELLP